MILMTDFGGRCGALFDDRPDWARELDLFLVLAGRSYNKRLNRRKQVQLRRQIRRRKHGWR